MKQLFIIFLVALTLRLIAFFVFQPLMEIKNTHSLELIWNSIYLEAHPYFSHERGGYTEWWQQSPAQVLYLHLIQRNIIITIIMSALTVLLFYRINPIFGWIWCFYPQDIIYSFQYGKESLLIFCIAVMISLVKNKKYWTICVPIIMLGFASYGTNHHIHSAGFINNILFLWKPSFDISILYSKWFQFIQAPFYVVMMWIFFRNIKFYDPEFILVLGFSLVFGLIYSEPHYRDPLIPIILLYILNVKKINTIQDLLPKKHNLYKYFQFSTYLQYFCKNNRST